MMEISGEAKKFGFGGVGGRAIIYLHYNKSFINLKNMISSLSFKELINLGIDIYIKSA